MDRSARLVGGAGVLGIALVVAVPVLSYVRMRQAEHAAAEALREVSVAQRAFRAGTGGGAYATDLASLTTPCPAATAVGGEQTARLRAAEPRYRLSLAAARGAVTAGIDCHGRSTASEYYAAAAPRTNGVDGREAFAMRSDGRIFLFFDGAPPREADMDPGGLAIPLDAVPTFKIP